MITSQIPRPLLPQCRATHLDLTGTLTLGFLVVHDTLFAMLSPKTLLLALANALIPIAILVFATGFFPYKPFMQGLATYEELGWEDKFSWKKNEQPEPVFDKLVFMVVDALRSDFVYAEGGGMKFVQRYVKPFWVEERGRKDLVECMLIWCTV
jgi:hypothetical protein